MGLKYPVKITSRESHGEKNEYGVLLLGYSFGVVKGETLEIALNKAMNMLEDYLRFQLKTNEVPALPVSSSGRNIRYVYLSPKLEMNVLFRRSRIRQDKSVSDLAMESGLHERHILSVENPSGNPSLKKVSRALGTPTTLNFL